MPPPKSYKTPVKPKRRPAKEEPGIVARLLPWLFIVVGLSAIVWLAATATPEKELNCVNTGGRNSLNVFGSCTTE